MKNTNRKTKKLVWLIASVLLVATMIAVAVPLMSGAVEAKGIVDVYIIAGQSNAEGYGEWNSADIAEGGELAEANAGYANVLLWGDQENHKTNGFVNVKLGLGQKAGRSGAEIGIAAAAKASGNTTAIVKVSVGNTSLYPQATIATATTAGSWASPSFIEWMEAGKDPSYEIMKALHADAAIGAKYTTQRVNLAQKISADPITYTSDDLNGDGSSISNYNFSAGYLYWRLVSNVQAAVKALRDDGYTPYLRGMWWMQGEADTWYNYAGDTVRGLYPTATAFSFSYKSDSGATVNDSVSSSNYYEKARSYGEQVYDQALRCLINDLRLEFKNMNFENRTELGKTPFVMGRIHFNEGYSYNSKTDPPSIILNSTTGRNNFTDTPTYIDAINAAQDFRADYTINVGVVDIQNYADVARCQQDKWHYNAKAQKWLGEQFVAECNKMNASSGGVMTDYGLVTGVKDGASGTVKNFAVFYKKDTAEGEGTWEYVASTDLWVENVNTSSTTIGALDMALGYEPIYDGSGNQTGVADSSRTDGKLYTNDADGVTQNVAIVVMKDCEVATTLLSNFGFMSGNLIVDLNGHTVKSTDGKAFFNAMMKHAGNTFTGTTKTKPLNVTVKNGALESGGNLIKFDAALSNGTYPEDGYGTTGTYADRKINFDFNNVRITSSADSLFAYGDTDNSVSYAKIMAATVDFNNCTVTMTSTGTNLCTFDGKDPDITKVRSIVNINVYGGQLNLPNLTSDVTRANIVQFDSSTGGRALIWSEKASGGVEVPVFTLRTPQDTPPELVLKNGSLAAYYPSLASDNAAMNTGYYTFGRTSVNAVGGRGHLFALLSMQNTKYGTAPAFFAFNPVDYPILIFNTTTKTLYNATNKWGKVTGATNALNGTPDTSANGGAIVAAYQIAKKENADDNTTGDSSAILFTSAYTIGEKVEDFLYDKDLTVDFGGYQINIGSYSMFNLVTKKSTTEYQTKIKIRNGTAYITGTAPFIDIYVQSGAPSTLQPDNSFDVTCENLTISYNTNETPAESMIRFGSATSSVAARNAIEFVGCTFNFFNFQGSAGYVLKEKTSGNGNSNAYVYATMTDCTVIGAASGASYTLLSGSSTYCALDLDYKTSGYTGRYMTVSTLGTTVPAWGVNIYGDYVATAGNTNYKFVKTGTETRSGKTYTVFTLSRKNDSTSVPGYSGAVEVPNYIYNNYAFIILGKLPGESTWTFFDYSSQMNATDTTGAFYCLNDSEYRVSGAEAVIYLTKNHTVSSGAYYNNISQIVSKVTFDLNGHVLTENSSATKSVFGAQSKDKDQDYDCQFTIKNGTINLVSGCALIEADGWSNTQDKKFTYKFDNVTLNYNNGKLPAVVKYTDSKAGLKMTLDVIFNNCDFNLTDASTAASTLFNADDTATGTGYTTSAVTVTVSGGSVRAATASQVATLFDNAEKVKFAKNSSDKYMSVVMNAGVDVSAGLLATKIPVSGGTSMLYGLAATDGTAGTQTYTLRSEEQAGFAPLANLTLDADIRFNVYIPKITALDAFSVDGVIYRNEKQAETDKLFSDALVLTIDGKEYYVVQVSLAASEAARNVIFKATLTVDGAPSTATWNLSIPAYAEKLIAQYDANYAAAATEEAKAVIAAEKQVVLDILHYIRSAYTYFNTPDTDGGVAKINTLLAGYTAPSSEGTAVDATKNEAYNGVLTGVSYNLSATPKLRYTFAENVGADELARFKFYANGVRLTATVNAAEHYIEVDMLAYQLTSEIICYHDNDKVVSFSLANYIAHADVQGNANLKTMMVALMGYGNSAEAYKSAVEAKNAAAAN